MRDIPGYEGRYAITEDGRVWSHPKKQGNGMTKGKFFIPHLDFYGYFTAHLSKDGKSKSYLISRLVCLTYLPNPENKKCVNHKNGIRTDNRLENLEWCTHSENTKHSYRELGRQLSGCCK